MQDTAMDDLEMDEMFDKHLEEHEAPRAPVYELLRQIWQARGTANAMRVNAASVPLCSHTPSAPTTPARMHTNSW